MNRIQTDYFSAMIAQVKRSILGGEIGYTIRFEDCSEEAVTKVKVWSPKGWEMCTKIAFIQFITSCCIIDFIINVILNVLI
jgi:hypothetical protein